MNVMHIVGPAGLPILAVGVVTPESGDTYNCRMTVHPIIDGRVCPPVPFDDALAEILSDMFSTILNHEADDS